MAALFGGFNCPFVPPLECMIDRMEQKLPDANGDNGGSKVFKFDPPLYIQRYSLVISELRNDVDAIDQLVDFGCAEGKFLSRARSHLARYIDTFIGVDADCDVLRKSLPYLEPKQDNPLDEERPGSAMLLYNGSIGEYDDRLRRMDAVVAIELIEHLYDDTLAEVPGVIFGQIQPYVAVITTPNVEFNALFDMGDRRFRHDDHKFEWTRKEFKDWCSGIVQRYPQYKVTYTGVGRAPDDVKDEFGFCSQAAVFRWKDKRSYFELKEIKDQEAKSRAQGKLSASAPYEMVARLIDAPRFTAARKERVMNDCRAYCMQKCDEATRAGAVGVWVSMEEMLHSSSYVEKLCRDVDTLTAVFISRDNCDWRMQPDWNNYQIYCQNEPYYDDTEEELSE